MDGPRACRPDEFDETMALINQTFRAGSDQDIRTDYPLIFNPDQLDYMRIVAADGKVVSHVPLAPRTVIAREDTCKIGIISPTVTAPDYRHRGYATLCLRDCIRIATEKGWPLLVLWTLEATFPFYHHSDFEAVGCQGRFYKLEPRDQALFDPGPFNIIQFDPTTSHHLGAIARIHDAEPYRIERSHSDYQALFTLPKTTTFVAADGDQVTAYLTLGAGTNKPGLIEAGGTAEGLEALLKHILSARDQQIQALVLLTPSVLEKVIEASKPGAGRPIEEAAGIGFQMIRLNSLEKLLRSSVSLLREKSVGRRGDLTLNCSDAEESFTIHFRDGEVDFSNASGAAQVFLTRRQWVQLIFGPHPSHPAPFVEGVAGELLKQVFPFYLPIWELDHS